MNISAKLQKRLERKNSLLGAVAKLVNAADFFKHLDQPSASENLPTERSCRFESDQPHQILCLGGGMVDTPVLGTGGESRGSSSLP